MAGGGNCTPCLSVSAAYETSAINRADKEAQNTDSVDGLAIRAQQWQ